MFWVRADLSAWSAAKQWEAMQSVAKQLCNFAVLNTASFRVSHTTTELLLNAWGKKEGVSLLLESSGLTKSQKGYQDQDAKVPRPTDRKRSSCDWTGILGTAATRAYDIPIRGRNCNTLQPGVGPYQYLQPMFYRFTSFTGLVPRCIESKSCNQILVGKLLTTSIRIICAL